MEGISDNVRPNVIVDANEPEGLALVMMRGCYVFGKSITFTERGTAVSDNVIKNHLDYGFK